MVPSDRGEKDHLLLSERRVSSRSDCRAFRSSPSAPPRCVFSRHIFPRSTQWDRTVCFRNKVRMEKRSWNAHGPINISMSPRLYVRGGFERGKIFMRKSLGGKPRRALPNSKRAHQRSTPG